MIIIKTVRWDRIEKDGFKVGMGLLQGPVLSPFLFAMAMDRLTDV